MVNSPAPRISDTNNAGLTVAAFDDGTEEGVGFIVEIPSGVTTMVIKYRVRAETAPGSTQTVKWNLYEREIPDNSAPTSWSSAFQLSDSSIPTNENFQYDQDSRSLATWGLTAGSTHQFEMTRDTGDGGDTLTGDADLLSIIVEFS